MVTRSGRCRRLGQGNLRCSCGWEIRQYPVNKGGGRGGIRTHGTVTRTPDFESGAFNHSATLPSQLITNASQEIQQPQNCALSVGTRALSGDHMIGTSTHSPHDRAHNRVIPGQLEGASAPVPEIALQDNRVGVRAVANNCKGFAVRRVECYGRWVSRR